MKSLKLIFGIVVMLFMASCSQSSSLYSPEKCERLKTIIDNKENLTESDYNEMIDQIEEGMKMLKEKQVETNDNKEKMQKFIMKEKNHKMMEYMLEFTFYLEAHKNDLSPATAERMLEVQRNLMKMRD